MERSMGQEGGNIRQAVCQYNGLGQRMGQQIFQGKKIQPERPERQINYTLDLTHQYHNLLQKQDSVINPMSADMQSRTTSAAQTYYWDGNVVSMEAEGEESYFLQDDLGSPLELTDRAGAVRESYAYDEFGASNIYSGKDIFKSPMQSIQPFGFTGYQMDEAGGLYFAQARRYDAGSGRFVSEDKARGFLESPFTLNHYGYCFNRSMDLVDLNGLYPMAIESFGDTCKDGVTSPSSLIGNGLDAIYSGVEVAVDQNTSMPSFRPYKNANGTKMLAISNSANYGGGRGGVRSISEAKLLTRNDTLTKAFKAEKVLKGVNVAIIGVGGALAFYDEYKQGADLPQDERVTNAGVEATWSVGSAVAIGALVGSIVPGAGTVAGAAIGFIVGGAISLISDALIHAKIFDDNTKSAMDYLKQGVNGAREGIAQFVSNAYDSTCSFFDDLGKNIKDSAESLINVFWDDGCITNAT